jgi:hypothetical protein
MREINLDEIHTNVPSLYPSDFARITDQAAWPLDKVLDRCIVADSLGINVQLNLVVSGDSPSDLIRVVQREIDAYMARPITATLALILDDRGSDPVAAQREVAKLIRIIGGKPVITHNPRTLQFDLNGRVVLATRCTQWDDDHPNEQVDTYVIPPGVVMRRFIHGRAYEPRGSA